MNFIGLNTAITFSNIYPENNVSTKYIHRFQYSAYYERYFPKIRAPKSSFKIGLQYTQKGQDVGIATREIKDGNNVVDLQRSSVHVELDYITIPISLKYQIIQTPTNQRVYLELGGYVSKLLKQKLAYLDFETETLLLDFPTTDIGVHIGAGIEFDFKDFYVNLPLIFVAEYTAQFGLTELRPAYPQSCNLTHAINVGIKFPTTIF